MTVIDDKASCVVKVDRSLLLPQIDSDEDITLKASFIATSNVKCAGKVTALFDLIVMGDIEAEELDVKGRFICHGSCIINKTIVVHGDILAETVNAESIICHDRIVAQSMDVTTVATDGKILLGKTLFIEEKAHTPQVLMCGETAYGPGKVIAKMLITAEEIDLDDGVDALEKPFTYLPKGGANSQLDKLVAYYREKDDYEGLIIKLSLTPDDRKKEVLMKFLNVLKSVDGKYPKQIHTLRDLSTLIWLLKISNTEYFRDWVTISSWTFAVKKHFDEMIHGKYPDEEDPAPAKELKVGYIVTHTKYGHGRVQDIKTSFSNGHTSSMAIIEFEEYGAKMFPIPGSLEFFMILSKNGNLEGGDIKSLLSVNLVSYSEWLDALKIIERCKEYLGNDLYLFIYELLLAKLGIKPHFVEERFKDMGWN